MSLLRSGEPDSFSNVLDMTDSNANKFAQFCEFVKGLTQRE